MGLQKNVAGQKWIVFAWTIATNVALSGDALNITANLRLDGGAANAVDDTNPTELEDGFYAFDLTQAETNADNIVICPASSTGGVAVIGCPPACWTDKVTPKLPTNYIMGSAVQTDKDDDIDAILVDTAVIGALGAGLTAITDKTNLIPADPATETNVDANETKIDIIAGYLDTEIAAILAAVDTEVAAIKAVTDKVDSALVADGAVYQFTANALELAPVTPTAATIADAVWDEIASGHVTAGSLGKKVTDLLQAFTGKWAITNNQLIMYDSDGVTPLYIFDLKQDGAPTEFNPDAREPV